MIDNKFSGIIISTNCDILDGMSDLGVCGSGDGTVLIWSHVLEEGASEDLTKNLVTRHPEIFATDEEGMLQYIDSEDTMLYFVR